VDAVTDDDLRRLPPLLTVPLAGRVLGIGRTVAYQLVRQGEWPTPVIRVGGQIRIPRAPLLTLIGVSTDATPPPEASAQRRRIKPQSQQRKGDDGRHHIQEMLLP
jgi:hypothetical protein